MNSLLESIAKLRQDNKALSMDSAVYITQKLTAITNYRGKDAVQRLLYTLTTPSGGNFPEKDFNFYLNVFLDFNTLSIGSTRDKLKDYILRLILTGRWDDC